MGKFMVGVARILPLCALLLVLLAMILSGLALAQQSTVTINPTQGPPGTGVIGTGINWRPGDRMQISWDSGEILANIIVGSDDTFSVSFNVPANAPEGAHTIYFTDLDSRYFLVATFTVGSDEARNCFDAYFIGVHGSTEGPDITNQNLPYSATIVETLNAFYQLAREKGKEIQGEE